jgi:hypothetical protein
MTGLSTTPFTTPTCPVAVLVMCASN